MDVRRVAGWSMDENEEGALIVNIPRYQHNKRKCLETQN